MLRLRRLIVPLLAIVTTAATAPAFAAEGPAQVSDPGNTTTATAQTSGDFGYVWSLATGQVVMPGAYLQALSVTHPGSTGTRSDEQFFQISSTGSNDVPSAALRAYKHAADVMAHDDPGCQIPWTLLAAIGRVESNHGRFGGAQLGSDGESRPAILGPVLDGTGAFAAIKDTDHGTMDGNKVWDRAVGQMQFLPSTWLSVARDGDGNGTKDPNNINDAALGAAVYLCGVGGSLANPTGMARAAFRYNHSDYYVQLVLSFQNGYDTGVFSVPSPPPPPTKTVKAATPAKTKTTTTTKTAATTPATTPASTPVSTPKPTPSSGPKTSPTPSPKPSPTPTPTPQVGDFTGTLAALADHTGYTLDGLTLDLGTVKLDLPALADYDGDGTIGTTRQELDALVAAGKPVTVHGSRLGSVITIDKVAGLLF